MVNQEEIKKMAQSRDAKKRRKAAYQLRINFSSLPDKQEAWEDLHRLVYDRYFDVRLGAVYALGSSFPHVPDKEEAWEDLHRLAHDKYFDVRLGAVFVLGSVFLYIPNKAEALKDLHRLTQDENLDVKMAAIAISSTLGVHQHTQDKDRNALIGAKHFHGSIFSHVHDAEKEWEDLIQLTQDSDRNVRIRATQSLGSAFSYANDKKKAWSDLHRLAHDKESYLRRYAAYAIGLAFPQIPSKEQAFLDMQQLAQDEFSDVRRAAADALGSALPHVSEKGQVWAVLYRLKRDEFGDVRATANHSLGRAFIFKATDAENEEDFKKDLEKALEFFEIASKEKTNFNPASFCLPFYRSYYTIAFNKQETEAEVQTYLTEAKNEMEESESQVKLLEAVQYLAIALREVHKAQEIDLNTMKSDLNAHRRYCERVTYLLGVTEKKAPLATRLLKKGLPIIDKKIRILLGEIEEKAKKFCNESRQTPFERISRSAYNHVKGIGKVESLIEAETKLNKLSPLLRSMCRILPEESRGVICRQLNEIEIADLPDKTRIIESALSSIAIQIKNLEDQKENLEEKLEEQEKWVEYFKKLVVQRLDNINYGVFRLKLRSGEIVPLLSDIQTELNKFKIIRTDIDNFGLSLTKFGNLQHQDTQRLNNEITRLCKEIEIEIIPNLPRTNDTDVLLEKVHDLKLCKEEVLFNRLASFSSIVSILLTMFPSLTK